MIEVKDLEAIQGEVVKGVKPVLDKVAATEIEVKALREENIALKTKVETIEKSPAWSAFNINRRPSEYKGYKLDKALSFGASVFSSEVTMRDFFLKSGFALKKEENIEEYAKNLIDIVYALKFRDAESIANLKEKGLIGMQQKDTAAVSESTATGGYLVAPEYQWDVIKLVRNRSYALQLCRVMPMISNVQYFSTELTMGSVTWETEGATKTPSEPTFGQVALTAKKAFCLARITNEELADTSVDVAGIITEQFAYATAQELDNQVFNGSGSPWSGVIAQAAHSVILSAGASISTLAFTDLSLAISKLYEGRLAGASFVISRLMKHYVRSLKDSYGRPIFAMPGNGVPGTIYEYPYYQSEKLTSTDGASKTMGIFGNFQYAILGRRQGLMNIDLDPYGLFDSDTTRFRMVTRWGFNVGMTDAFCNIKTAGA